MVVGGCGGLSLVIVGSENFVLIGGGCVLGCDVIVNVMQHCKCNMCISLHMHESSTHAIFARGVDVFEVVKAFDHAQAAVELLDDPL